VLAELLRGKPLFVAADGVSLFNEFVLLLGTPSYKDMQAMNPSLRH
jgi:hypothetical protein